jgi:charged multivesicular body protein 4
VWQRLYAWLVHKLTLGTYRPPVGPQRTPREAIAKIDQVVALLEHAEEAKERRSNEELAKARELNRAGNRRGARAALRQHRFLQDQLESLAGTRSTLEDHRFKLESANMSVEIFKVMQDMGVSMGQLKLGVTSMQADTVMDQMKENMDDMDDLTQSISKPMREASMVSDADLDDELDRMLAQDERVDSLKAALATDDPPFPPFSPFVGAAAPPVPTSALLAALPEPVAAVPAKQQAAPAPAKQPAAEPVRLAGRPAKAAHAQ